MESTPTTRRGQDLLGNEPATPLPLTLSNAETEKKWSWSFVPRKQGMIRVGGLRILVLEDVEEKGGGETEEKAGIDVVKQAEVLKEWDVIRELWIAGPAPL
ncbi:hypothetical protein BT69DRAFT_1291284 [Atractiella rhizophila]|nr:hypothetical protein BT69DRAFT_1291284 [Atractiella rhizophila]